MAFRRKYRNPTEGRATEARGQHTSSDLHAGRASSPDKGVAVKDKELIALADKARAKAYAPYSGFSVGAAVLAASGEVYTGCNVENASYGLSMCAERTAAFKAACAGEREFTAIAVATDTGWTPCGACRQVLVEFGPRMRILAADAEGNHNEYGLNELLLDSFGPSDLSSE
jgi:cytidine deaminase